MNTELLPPRSRIGEILINKGWLSGADLDQALEIQKKGEKKPLGLILISHGMITSETVYQALAIQFGKKFVNLKRANLRLNLYHIAPKEFLLQHRMMPIAIKNGNVLVVAVSDPLDIWPLSQLEAMANIENSEIVLATPEDIELAIKRNSKISKYPPIF